MKSLLRCRFCELYHTLENWKKVIEIIAGGRGVRMDIYFEDDEKALYNLEMQNSNEGDLPRRSRY
ncbi:MAG: hypothetical protein IIZ34_01125, partial [Eubacterium sp.]|nr:hypothetical protein [Eubacterium sp.]